MRYILLSLCLLTCWPGPCSAQAVQAQEREGSCPSPGLHSRLSRLPLSSGPGGRGPDSLEPDLYVSPDGRLCGSFQAGVGPRTGFQTLQNRLPQPGKAFLLSAALPGAGQRLLGQNRWVAYVATEAWAWIQYLNRRSEGKRLQRRYRDLAWHVARRVSTGPRMEAGWEYYEALTKYESSGAFDSDPLSLGIQPEGDPDTFNGFIWALAQEIFLPEDPEAPVDPQSGSYQKAHQYYLSRAYPQNLAWNWGSNSLHQTEYTSLIQASDENLRRSTTMIGVIVANHLLSAVDALVSGRLALAREEESRMELLLEPGPFRTETLVFRVRLPAPVLYEH